MLFELLDAGQPACAERALQLRMTSSVVVLQRLVRKVDLITDATAESNDLLAVEHLLIEHGMVAIEMVEQAIFLSKFYVTTAAPVAQFERADGLRLFQVHANVTIVAVERFEFGLIAVAALIAMVGGVL